MVERRPREIHADDHHLAMREIHHAHDAEDHRQAERHQAVDHAGQQPLGDRLCQREKEVLAQVRCLSFQPSCGKTSGATAASFGNTTVGERFRFCSTAMPMLTFWPLASNWIGPPIITCSSILTLRSASISTSDLVDLAASQALAAISSASKVKPASRSNWSLGNCATWCFSSDCVIADFGFIHGSIASRYSPYLPVVLMKSSS